VTRARRFDFVGPLSDNPGPKRRPRAKAAASAVHRQRARPGRRPGDAKTNVQAIEVQSLPEGLAERLAADASRVFSLQGTPRVARSWHERNAYSDVYRVQLSWGSEARFAFVKIPIKRPVNERLLDSRLAAEHAIISELSARFAGDRQLGAVRPFGYYPEQLAIATVEIPGDTLRQRLSRYARRLLLSTRNRERLHTYARLCGLWLRRFHEVTSRGVARFDADDLVDYCRARLALIDGKTPMPLGPQVSTRILARIREVAGSAAATDNPVAGRHNDFASHNIIVDDRPGICVLDFSMFDHGSTYFDVCNFWYELDTLKSDPTYSPTTLSGLQGEFLGAYGSIVPTHPLFMLVRCRYTLNRLLTTLNLAPAGRLSALYRQRLAVVCRHWLIDFAADRAPARVGGQ
jgi:hypothetical protein